MAHIRPSASAGGLLACMLVVAGAKAEALGFGARLLLVQKDGRSALFLPESHIGSPAQEDNYFRTVLRPAFAASSVLLAERSSVSWLDPTYEQAACLDEGEAEASLDPALNEQLRRHVAPTLNNLPPMLNALSPVDKLDTLDRFMRYYLVFTHTYQRSHGKISSRAGAHSFTIRNAQSGILLAQAPHRVASVEDTGTWQHAYCAMLPEERAALIADTIVQSAQRPEPDDAGKSGSELRAATYRDNDAAYRQTLEHTRAALNAPAMANHAHDADTLTAAKLAIDKFILVERSRAWVADLPAVLRRERLPFYALGAAHFADGPSGPGLVTLLREAGYKVSLLNDRHALDASLSQLPPAARPGLALTMHVLPGGCQRDGDIYGCDWSDKSTSYFVVNTGPSLRREAWSACFEREGIYGPEKHCVSSLRQASAARAADLSSADNASTIDEKPSPDSVP